MPAPSGSLRRVPVWLAVLLVASLGGCRDSGTRAASGARSSTSAGAAAPSVTLSGSAGSAANEPSTAPASASPTASPGTGAAGTAGTAGVSVPGTTVPAAAVTTVVNGGGAPGGPGLPPSPPPTDPVVVGGGGVATGLVAQPACDPANRTRAFVKLQWAPGGGGEQLVAVSTRPDGFATGVQAVSPALPADRSSYDLADSQPGGVYYWRVLTRVSNGWAASATEQFQGPTCVAF